MNRYDRQVKLKEFGDQGQEELRSAKVLVIGAGGLGCPALQYLTGAGVGFLGIIDHDAVSLDNLHRQILYSETDIGSNKAMAAADRLKSLNSEIQIRAYTEFLCKENIERIFTEYDLILDGTDNFDSRYLINDAAAILKKILIQGAVNRYQGQLAVFNAFQFSENPANYRDLFPEPPIAESIPNCEEAGVIGTLPGIIGSLMASEAIKIITGIGQPLFNTLLTYDSLSNQSLLVEITPAIEKDYFIPDSISELDQINSPICNKVIEIGLENISTLLNESCLVIDIRENEELPKLRGVEHLQIPMSGLSHEYDKMETENILLICATGKRSLNAGKQLANFFGNNKNIYSLKGGIPTWTQFQQHGK